MAMQAPVERLAYVALLNVGKSGKRDAMGVIDVEPLSLNYVAVTGVVAWVVYGKVGLVLLRKAWFNLDVIWAAALLVAGLVTFVV